MKSITYLSILLFLFQLNSSQAQTDKSIKTNQLPKTKVDWKKQLSEKDFHILREKGTERAFTGIYNSHYENGIYHCKGCNTPLFKSTSKYDSGSGWPAFDKAMKGKLNYTKDNKYGMIRTEITCKTCNGHLGHVFDDGPRNTTGKRYCVNSASLSFEKK